MSRKRIVHHPKGMAFIYQKLNGLRPYKTLPHKLCTHKVRPIASSGRTHDVVGTSRRRDGSNLVCAEFVWKSLIRSKSVEFLINKSHSFWVMNNSFSAHHCHSLSLSGLPVTVALAFALASLSISQVKSQ